MFCIAIGQHLTLIAPIDYNHNFKAHIFLFYIPCRQSTCTQRTLTLRVRVCDLSACSVCSDFTYCSYFLCEGLFFFLGAFLGPLGWQVSHSAPCAEPQRLSAVPACVHRRCRRCYIPPACFGLRSQEHGTVTASQPSLQSVRLRESAGSLCRVQSKCVRARHS